jgi:TPR repeat protein
MNPAARPWLLVLFGLLALSPASAHAGMTPGEVKAFNDIKAKAERGDRLAQCNLAKRYANGEGVALDQLQAVSFYRKAATQGLAEAQFLLGLCYFNGCEGVVQDEVQAVSFYRKAAEQGYAEAQNALGGCYFLGQGLAQDRVKAVSFYRKAAEQGLPEAQFTLGACFMQGQGVAKDPVQGVAFIRKAAEQGYGVAQLILGEFYKGGEEGVAQDKIEAYAYFSLAVITNKDARNPLANLEKKLSADQIADGKKRAAELQKQIDAKNAAKKPRK